MLFDAISFKHNTLPSTLCEINNPPFMSRLSQGCGNGHPRTLVPTFWPGAPGLPGKPLNPWRPGFPGGPASPGKPSTPVSKNPQTHSRNKAAPSSLPSYTCSDEPEHMRGNNREDKTPHGLGAAGRQDRAQHLLPLLLPTSALSSLIFQLKRGHWDQAAGRAAPSPFGLWTEGCTSVSLEPGQESSENRDTVLTCSRFSE